jgi:hypothetical protein
MTVCTKQSFKEFPLAQLAEHCDALQAGIGNTSHCAWCRLSLWGPHTTQRPGFRRMASCSGCTGQREIHQSAPQPAVDPAADRLAHSPSQLVPATYRMDCPNSSSSIGPACTHRPHTPLAVLRHHSGGQARAPVVLNRQTHRMQASQPGLGAKGHSLRRNEHQTSK